MKINFILLCFAHLFCLNTYGQTFISNQNYSIEYGCSDSLDVTINLSDESLPILDGSQFGIAEVCINIDHTWISDIDVFLRGPMGVSVELSTDNGSFGDNYIGTCFKMNGNNGPITFGVPPMTGNYIPEGDLNNFNNNYNPNGIWELILCDDQQGFSGMINNWSITFGAPTFTQCNSLDSFVLVDFYQQLGGEDWSESDGWLNSNVPYSEWYGVQVDQNGCVTKLNLESNNLNGPLYQNLDLLSQLSKINFQNNELYDSLPSSWGNLEFLDSLNLSNNLNLAGEYPESYLDFCAISYRNFDGTQLPNFNDFCGIVSLSEAVAIPLNLFPNPFSNAINIESTRPIKSIRLFNASGSLIQTFHDQMESELNLSNL